MAADEIIGQGRLVSGGATVGTLRRADAIDEVFALMKREDLDETILLVESASTTTVVPLLARVGGIVCCSGGPTSHLALVSKEFGIPCVMGAELNDPAVADGSRVSITSGGAIVRA